MALFQLKISDEFSKQICVVCNFQLKDFCMFKRNVVELQKGLYRFATNTSIASSIKQDIDDELNVKSELEESNDETEHQDGSDLIEPEVKILDESEFLDYNSDLNVGTLQFYLV